MAGCGCVSVTGWGRAAGSDGHARAGSGGCRPRCLSPSLRLLGNRSLGLGPGPAPAPPRPSTEASGTASFLRILVLPPHPAQLPLGDACEPFPFLVEQGLGVGVWSQVCAGVCKCVAQVCVVCVCGECDVCAGVAGILYVCMDVRGACAQMYEMQVFEVCVRGGGGGTAADPLAAGQAGVLHLGARLTPGQDVVRPPGGSGSPRGGSSSLPGHSEGPWVSGTDATCCRTPQ